MKNKLILLSILMLMAPFLMGQIRKSLNLPEHGIIYEHFPLSVFKGDTTEFFMVNYFNNGRYENKTFEFFFSEFEKDLPIKSVWFVKPGIESVGMFMLFYETKERILKRLKADQPVRAILTSIQGLPRKGLYPDLYAYIQKHGFDRLLDMTVELRNILKDKAVYGISVDNPSEAMQIDLRLIPPTKYYNPHDEPIGTQTPPK